MGERVQAYIGLGANVGDARRTLTDALAALGALPGARLRGVSRLYRTNPVGVVDQPDFLNAVVALDVPAGVDPATGATSLLVDLKRLEREFGRQARGRWGPRELDLDLLIFGHARLAIDRPPEAASLSATTVPASAARLLEVPHPSMQSRLFVLAPLSDLAPGLVPPGWRETVETARRRQVAIEGPAAVAVVPGPGLGPITVRRAIPDDAVDAAAAHTAAAEAAYRGFAPTEPDGLGRRTGVWREILANPENQSFVAVDDGRIAGVLNIGPFREEPALGAVRILYVRPEWWGTGAGQQLMDLAHAELAAVYDEARLTVLTANGRARRFYERNGWSLTETLVEPHFGGMPTQVCRYRRLLR